ncbi:MAG: lipoate--protein ligase family protein [Candidatus Micrarchaeaceae archaeon]
MVAWRLIGLERNSACMNMGIDEAIIEGVKAGSSKPTIRFYKWSPSAVSIGRFQSMRDEVNIDVCKSLGIDYVRRITGGGAVYHDAEGELTYSIIAPETLFPRDIKESYALICGWIINGLKTIGLDAQFSPINDISVNGKKISGNAQTRREGVLLQHGTILYKLDIARMFSVLNVSKEKISDKMIKNAEERVTSVHLQSGLSFEELYRAVMNGITANKECEVGFLSGNELNTAIYLSKTYSSDAWNFSR